MRYLLVRIGGYGDVIIITPVISHLKSQGHEVYVLTSEVGMDVLAHNPHIDNLILHVRDSVDCDKLDDHFKALKEQYKCDVMIDYCESLEEKYLFHPTNPKYNYPKQERIKIGNFNFYDGAFEHAGFDIKGRNPEMYFSEQEEDDFSKFRVNLLGKFVILWCMSGSSLHKAYPYTHLVVKKMLEVYPDVVFVTVGNTQCQLIEEMLPDSKRVIKKSGKWSFRETALGCKYADMVVAPETGVIHLAGCFDTPKFCFLTHTTKECVTKYFKNDHSMQAGVTCSPCFRIIYETKAQCPVDEEVYAPFCTAFGFKPEDILGKLEKVYNERKELVA